MWSKERALDACAAPADPHDERHEEENQKQIKQNLGNARGGYRYAREA